MMILVLLPIIGPLAFLKYGFHPFHKTNYANQIFFKQKLNEIEKYNTKADYSSNSEIFNFLSDFSIKVTESLPDYGNIVFYANAEKMYHETLQAIRSAKKIIFINFYCIADGVWLRTVANELIQQVAKGVKVYFLFDWVGSRKRYPKKLIRELNEHGVNTKIFKPRRLLYISGYDNSRSHKKILIIDNQLCLYGGFNLSDEYLNYSRVYEYWYDNAFKITGNIVREYIKSFVCDWVVYSDDNLKNKIFEDVENFDLLNVVYAKTNSLIQIYDSTPELLEYQTINFLILAITKAKQRVWISTPYLYPTEYLINLLIVMAKAGIDIRILVPGLPDNKPFIIALNRSQYTPLLKAGIKIYEVNAFCHAKSIIIDQDVSIIGTCNLDPRAMNVNYENLSLVACSNLNRTLTENFESILRQSHEITIANKPSLSIKDWFLVKLLLIWEPIL